MDNGLGMNKNLNLRGRDPNSQWASITSSPLFIKEALSMVTFLPMRHWGWFKACEA